MRTLAIALALLAVELGGCSQFHYFNFANCTAYDVRTSHMPWNPIHRMMICYDSAGAHYFPETGSTAGLVDMLTQPMGTMLGHLPTPPAAIP